MNKNKNNRIFGVGISWATMVTQIIVSLLFVPFFLKAVGDRQYGLYTFSSSVIAWLSTFLVAITTGYYKFMTREKKEKGDDGELVCGSVFCNIYIALAFIMLLVGLLFDFLIYKNIINLSEYSINEKNQICILIFLSVISSFITTIFTVQRNHPYYKQKYIFIYVLALLEIITQTIISYLFLKNGYGILTVAFVHFSISVCGTLITVFFSTFLLKQKVKLFTSSQDEKKYRKVLLKEILVFSVFVIANVVASILNSNMDKTLLGFFYADGVANYQLGNTFPSYLASFTLIFTTVSTKRMTDAYYQSGREEMDKVFIGISKAQTILTMLILGGFFCVGREFLFLWLGEERKIVFVVAVTLLLVNSLTCSNSISSVAKQILDYHKKSSLITLGVVLCNMVLSITFVMLFPKDYAIYGCLLGTIISSVAGDWIIMSIFDAKITKLSMGKFYKTFFLYFAFSLLLAFVINLVFDISLSGHGKVINLFLKGFIFVLLYGLFVLLLNKKKALDIFKNIKKRIIKTKDC